ncbi:MAG: hypothetical protein KIT33_00440 [Candidatus Kapabacteria bacterium]|nr:hypothetical protein [Ignavibacteriota bacterium]MCW5883416.1 hypothetical protein [Candidatus Kapabacteria bacterium]
MTDKEIVKWCSKQSPEIDFIDISDSLIKEINESQANYILNYFSHNTLFKLPQSEIDFFEWLKVFDEKVWLDLWKDDELNPPYYVSLLFLPVLIKGGYRGFPICDLLENDNYYFAPVHLVDKESQIFAESSKTRFMNRESLTVPQLLAIEISMDPIDIWHFAYKHKIEITEAKKAVKSLVDDELLVHLKEAGYLATFLDF